MRGEDGSARNRPTLLPGSPPHARGRLATARARQRKQRITPACAGKTRLSPSTELNSPDHPRMRGEDRQADLESPKA